MNTQEDRIMNDNDLTPAAATLTAVFARTVPTTPAPAPPAPTTPTAPPAAPLVEPTPTAASTSAKPRK